MHPRVKEPTLATMPASAPARPTYRLPFVISASAAGTIIEWYDFYLYGVLAAFFSTQFFRAMMIRPTMIAATPTVMKKLRSASAFVGS